MVGAELVLEVKNLKAHFFLDQGVLRAVDGVSFTLHRGETLGIVGESGCGKSVTARAILRLISEPVGRIVDGAIVYTTSLGDRTDLAQLDPLGAEMRSIRGAEIAMIFQEPMTSLNPVYTVGAQIIEAIQLHEPVTKAEARRRAITMLQRVGIPEAEQRIDQYQHQYSGGMRQRAMIAMSLSCNPRILIADEPTTALDVTIEAQILDLIMQIQAETEMALMIITHDLNVIGEIADNVLVMYLGKVVEQSSVVDLFDRPRHPYTQGLLASLPQIGRKARLTSIAGNVPGPHERLPGCAFAPRCPHVMPICQREPPTVQIAKNTLVACWLYAEEAHD